MGVLESVYTIILTNGRITYSPLNAEKCNPGNGKIWAAVAAAGRPFRAHILDVSNN
jgi:hypothetical protein